MNKQNLIAALKPVWLSCRPNFLMLSIMMLLLACALVEQQQLQWSASHFWLLFISVATAHAAVNLRNEIDDTESGLDAITVKTPFSGGTGALLNSADTLVLAKRTYLMQMVILFCLGSYFVVTVSEWLLLLGLIGLLLIRFYTSHLTHFPMLCWLASGLGFGSVMLLGSYWVLSGELNWQAIVLSLIPFLWVNNLLLLNQIPDLHADRQVGRINLWMRYGSKTGLWVFIISSVLSLLIIGFFAYWSGNSLLYLALLWSLPMTWLVVKLGTWLRSESDFTEILPLNSENLLKLRPILAVNVIINLLLPLSLSLLLIL